MNCRSALIYLKNLGFKRGELIDPPLILDRPIHKKDLRVSDLAGHLLMGNVFCEHHSMNHTGLFLVTSWNLSEKQIKNYKLFFIYFYSEREREREGVRSENYTNG